jgi:DNA invertase Pin-like site-specific DNA recombinase|tara:strand:- start:47 stop:736 length:690 start_codon:yes stop_codon:yes gene_type:complete
MEVGNIQMAKHRGKFVGYVRVSTDKQGKEGLGIAAQKDAINTHLNGGQWELLKVFEEVESGKKSDRPELTEALAYCKKHKAKLVIARLDRLARNLYFIASLIESGIDFECCDMPQANKMTIQILAAVAEAERDRISMNTKRALHQAKLRGVQLGNPTNLEAAAKRGNETKKAMADDKAAQLRAILVGLEQAGVTSLQGVADALNARGIPTARGGQWYPSTVSNYMKRLR